MIDEHAEIQCLRAGDETAPFFCIYGVDLYQALADCLDVACAVYGIYVPELAEPERDECTWMDFDPVSRMAWYVDRYHDIIRRMQPQGPYRLGGASFGGMVALEVARRLQQAGDVVTVLCMFDTVAPGRSPELRLDQRLRLHFRLMRRYGIGYLYDRLKARLGFGSGANTKTSATTPMSARARLKLARMKAREHMMAGYHPDPYRGSVDLFRAEEYDLFDARCWEYDMGWSRLIDRLHIHDITGDHISILKPGNVEAIARIISERFRHS